jgi:SAM-dependent methyltransferase
MLTDSGGDFLRAVGASPETPRQRCRELSAAGVPLHFLRYDGRRIPLPDDSVGLIVSRSVLEHVHRDDVEPLVREMLRVSTSDGLMLHIIDLRDHMRLEGDVVVGDWLDALTYPEWLFNAMFSKRPVLINRFRANEWRNLFESNGFRVLVEKQYRLPLPEQFMRDRLDKRWRSLNEDILTVARIGAVLSPADR